MDSRNHQSGPEPPPLAENLAVLGALMFLLLFSAGAALLPLGPFNIVIGLGTAAVKALLVLIFFMRLKTDRALLRLVAGIGFLWLALLVTLTLADLLARGPLVQ